MVQSMKMTAYMMSYLERSGVRERTVANLLTTDWNELPVIQITQPASGRKEKCIVHSSFQLLQHAIADGSQLIIFLEDDLRFNRCLQHNLENWYPLVQVRPGHHFFGSLYNPGVMALESHSDKAYFVADPQSVYASCALILSLTTAQYVIQYWEQVDGFQDFKISRLASTVCPLYYHAPSLVQHIGYQSTWGGPYHRASDFQPDWKAMAY